MTSSPGSEPRAPLTGKLQRDRAVRDRDAEAASAVRGPRRLERLDEAPARATPTRLLRHSATYSASRPPSTGSQTGITVGSHQSEPVAKRTFSAAPPYGPCLISNRTVSSMHSEPVSAADGQHGVARTSSSARADQRPGHPSRCRRRTGRFERWRYSEVPTTRRTTGRWTWASTRPFRWIDDAPGLESRLPSVEKNWSEFAGRDGRNDVREDPRRRARWSRYPLMRPIASECLGLDRVIRHRRRMDDGGRPRTASGLQRRSRRRSRPDEPVAQSPVIAPQSPHPVSDGFLSRSVDRARPVPALLPDPANVRRRAPAPPWPNLR